MSYMKRAILCIFVGMLGVSYALAQNSLSVLGSYQDTKDGDAGGGVLARYQYDFAPPTSGLQLLAQTGYLTGFGDSSLGIDVIPIEAALLYDFKNPSGFTPYVGAGVGLYIPRASLKDDPSTSRSEGSASLVYDVSVSVDAAAVGFLAIAGVEKKFTDRFAVFAEMRYTSLKIKIKQTDTMTLSSAPLGFYYSGTWSVSSDADLSGIGGSVGVSYTF